MKYKRCMIAWNVKGKITVVPWPDTCGLARAYRMTAGACYTEVAEYSELEVRVMVLANFHTVVVRDGINPQEAHDAFLAIDEYRKVISPDIRGAD